MASSTSNKRIAKNAVFLYGRMLLTMAIYFYASRILLERLGVDNYGIYNVVGGIVVMFASLRTIFASSIQRYINAEIGKENGDVNKVFSLGVYIQIFVAVLFVIVVEIAGYFMLDTLNIPPDRLWAAKVVFQFSICTAVVSMMTVPYDAMIIAYERMDVFAYISIYEAVAKLLIIYLIGVMPFDVLVGYAGLIILVTFTVFLFNMLYCRHHFKESRISKVWDKTLFRDMSSFAGWNFLGNLSYSLSNEGINFLLNMFGNVTLNAARGLAYTLKNVITQLFTNVLTAYRPQSIILFTQKRWDEYYKLLFQSAKLEFMMCVVFSVPMFVFAREIFELWLSTVPDYSVAFLRAIIVYLLIRVYHGPIDVMYMASGQLREYQLCEIILLSSSLPLAYLFLKLGLDYYMVFIAMAIMELVNLCAIIAIAVKKFQFRVIDYIKNVIVPTILALLAGIAIHIPSFCMGISPEGIIGTVLAVGSDVALMCALSYFIICSKEERNIIKNLILGRIQTIKKKV